MAVRWRIRHKLTLGLVLVVGIMALLLVGTFKGLLSYRETMKVIDSKLEELKAAQALQEAVNELDNFVGGDSSQIPNPEDFVRKIAATRDALDRYKHELTETIWSRRATDNGREEYARVLALENLLGKLKGLAQQPFPGEMVVSGPGRLKDEIDKGKAGTLQQIRLNVGELGDLIYNDLGRRILGSKDNYRTSIALVICTSVMGALFLIGLARLAYRWIVDPIRDLHEKVGRLAEGNFDSRIEVQSRDEMQDLAEAFNNMAERLQAIYRDLARQVNERSRQLVRSERLAGVGFLAAGVAHEINNPLASIAFCSEALERRLQEMMARRPNLPAHDAETVGSYLKMIQEEAFRCKEITQRLLEFSRVGERRRQMTDLADLVQSVIDMVLHLQSHKDKQIVFQPRERPHAQVNAQEIKSVVLNLVVNSLESMDDGGVLTVRLTTDDGMAAITFADTGCGMTAEVLENIFEPFFTRSRTGRGTGLGLSISHRVITQHGGDIEAASPGPGQGSTFTVRLPLIAPVAEEAIARAA